MAIRDILMSAAGSGIPAGQRTYDVPGTYSFQVPSDTYSISVLCVGGGGGGASGVANSATLFLMYGAGGGGGALAYVNNISVTPGEFLSVVVGAGGPTSNTYGVKTDGGDSYIARGTTKLCHVGGGVSASIGRESPSTNPIAGTGGVVYVGTGGSGGRGEVAGGGGGAGGYAGAGGNSAQAGTGGGGGGGADMNYRTYSTSTYTYDIYIGGSGGGGVDVLGQGTSGAAGVKYNYGSASNVYSTGGGGGSGGLDGGTTTSFSGSIGGSYGGGGGAGNGQMRQTISTGAISLTRGSGGSGQSGAVRIIWSGTTGITRAFPSTNTGNI